MANETVCIHLNKAEKDYLKTMIKFYEEKQNYYQSEADTIAKIKSQIFTD